MHPALRLVRTITTTAALAAVVACAQGGRSTDGSTSTAATRGAVASLDEGSVYDVPVTLTDASGGHVALADLRYRVLVASMIYTSCTSVCPRVAEDMKAIEHALSPKIADGVTFAMFSLDPGRDTPTALQTFAAMHNLDARWRLFASSEDDVRTLAALFGVKYVREDSGEFAHSATIVLIDRDGVVRRRQIGLGDDPGPLVDAISALVGPN